MLLTSHDVYLTNLINSDFSSKRVFRCKRIIHNLLNLNIKNTFDLVEKLTPFLYFVFSDLEKLKKY